MITLWYYCPVALGNKRKIIKDTEEEHYRNIIDFRTADNLCYKNDAKYIGFRTFAGQSYLTPGTYGLSLVPGATGVIWGKSNAYGPNECMDSGDPALVKNGFRWFISYYPCQVDWNGKMQEKPRTLCPPMFWGANAAKYDYAHKGSYTHRWLAKSNERFDLREYASSNWTTDYFAISQFNRLD